MRMENTTDTRQRIIDVAKSRFHSRSYADVGVKEICDNARVQRGSFYHFFPSKRDLILAVIEEFAEEWATGFVAEAFDRRPDLFAKVERAFDGLPMAHLHFRKDDSYWDAIDRAGL